VVAELSAKFGSATVAQVGFLEIEGAKTNRESQVPTSSLGASNANPTTPPTVAAIDCTRSSGFVTTDSRS
jgi:hypothetical protein